MKVRAVRILPRRESTLVECVRHLERSEQRAKRLVNEGMCCVNSLRETFYRRKVKPGDVVSVSLNPLVFAKPKPEILYRDRHFVVVSKPPFLNTTLSKPSLEWLLRKKFQCMVVHRLDRHTSGALIVAKDRTTFQAFKQAFKSGKVEKWYMAVVSGKLRKRQVISAPLDGRSAKTCVEPLETFADCTLLLVKIETGRKHQIRRHLAGIFHPVLGESGYRQERASGKLTLFAPRLLLHAYKLSFPHPFEDKVVSVKAPVPEDFAWFLRVARKEEELEVETIVLS